MNLVVEFTCKIDEQALKKYVTYLQNTLNINRDFTIVIVDNDYIQQLNFEFRNKNIPTDVLTFVEDDDKYLGDIIISYEKVISQAQEYQHSRQRELYFLITHGFLHLLGYDHQTAKEETEMFTLQKKLLNNYGVKR